MMGRNCSAFAIHLFAVFLFMTIPGCRDEPRQSAHAQGLAHEPKTANPTTSPSDSPPLLREVLFGQQKKGDIAHSVVFTPDHKHLAFGVRSGTSSYVVFDGEVGPTFDDLGVDSLTLSGNGACLAYLAREAGQTSVVFHSDGLIKQFPANNALAPYLSLDGKKLVYIVSTPQGQAVVIDGKRQSFWSGIGDESISGSLDGTRVGYAVNDQGRWRVVVDGAVVDHPGNAAGGPIFSPNGRRVAFAVTTESGWKIIVDGKASRTYDRLRAGFLYSDDCSHYAYVAEDAGKQFVVLDGAEQPKYDSVVGVQFSPDDSHFSYFAFHDNGCSLVIDGKRHGPFDSVSDSGIVYSPVGGHFACCVLMDEQWQLFRDGSLVPNQPEVNPTHVQFTPDGEDVVLWTDFGENDQIALVIRGERQTPWQAVLGEVVFSPGGDQWAYLGKNGSNVHVVRNGVPTRAYDEVIRGSLHFIGDGRHLVFAGIRNDRVRINIDGDEVASYRGYINGTFLAVDDSGTVHGLVVDDEQVKLIEINANRCTPPNGDGSPRLPEREDTRLETRELQNEFDKFIRACHDHDISVIMRYFDLGGTGNGVSTSGETAFSSALKSRHIDVSYYLLAQSVDPNTRCSKGWTALHYAIDIPDPVLARQLIDAGAGCHLKSKKGLTPLDLLKREKLVSSDLEDRQLSTLIDNRLHVVITALLDQATKLRKQGLLKLRKQKGYIAQIKRALIDIQQNLLIHSVIVKKRFDPHAAGWIYGYKNPDEAFPGHAIVYSITDIGNYWKDEIEIDPAGIIDVEDDVDVDSLPLPTELAKANACLNHAIATALFAYGGDSQKYKSVAERVQAIADSQ